jgi:hypothetical protein
MHEKHSAPEAPGNFTEEVVFSTPWFDLVARKIPTDNTIKACERPTM